MDSRLKKLGLVGIVFFTVKGLLWLAVPAVIVVYKGCSGSDNRDRAREERHADDVQQHYVPSQGGDR